MSAALKLANTSPKMADCRVVPVSRELARLMQGLEVLPGDRKLSPSRLAEHRAMILAGMDKIYEWAVAVLGDRKIRLNGNHTSYLYSQPDIPIQSHSQVCMSYYPCDTMDEVVLLYQQFDKQKNSRTRGDLLSAFVSNHPVLKHLIKRACRAVQTALHNDYVFKRGKDMLNNLPVGPPNLPTHEKDRLLAENVEFAQWWNDRFHGTDVRLEKPDGTKGKFSLFDRAGVCYAALQTYRKDPEAATVFWEAVKGGEKIVNTQTATYHLQQFLKYPASSHRSRGKKLGEHTAYARDWEEQARRCLHAWNLWRQNKEVLSLQPVNKMPVVL